MSTISGNFINAHNQRNKKRKDQKECSRNRSKGLPSWIFRGDPQSFSIFASQTIDLVEDVDEDLCSLECHMNYGKYFEAFREDWFSIIIHSSPTRQPSKPNHGNLQRKIYLKAHMILTSVTSEAGDLHDLRGRLRLF